jgi:hypothetical protein
MWGITNKTGTEWWKEPHIKNLQTQTSETKVMGVILEKKRK